jgi:energy-coupling factor transporter transmembrane protein EcfT
MSVIGQPVRDARSPLGRRNPTIKLVVLFVVSLVVMFVFDPVTPAVLYLLALLGVLASSRMPVRLLMLAHIPFLGFALGLFIVNALSRPGDIFAEWGLFSVTVPGITVGASLALRTLVIGVLAVAFVFSTDGVTLTTSLHQQGRLSARLTYAILAGYRMLQEMPQEWQIIRHAQSVRAPLRPNGRPRAGALAFGRAAFALLVSAIRKGERMSESLESRGLGLTPRTIWRPITVERCDWFFLVGVLCTLALVLMTSKALGYLRGMEALVG